MRVSPLVLPLAAALLAVAGRAAPGAAQGPYFAIGDTLDLTLEDLLRGKSEWLRTSQKVAAPRVQLISAGGLPLHRIATLHAPIATLTDSMRLSLAAVSDTASYAPGTYTGTIVVRDSSGKQVLAQQLVRVTVPRAPSGATAVAGTWTAEIYKGAPLPGVRTALFPNAASRCAPSDTTGKPLGRWLRRLADRCVRDEVVPLSAIDTPATLVRAKTVLGVLTDSAGDHAFVWWKGDNAVKAGPGSVASRGLKLEFTSFDHPAIYTGQIDLTPGVRGGVVALTVKVTHAMLWPLVAILFGVVLSHGLRRYLQAKRTILDLADRSAALQAEYDSATREILGVANYNIDPAILESFERADGKIHQLSRVTGALESGNTQYDDSVKLLDELQQEVRGWSNLGKSLARLKAALKQARPVIRSAAERNALGPKENPQLVKTADKLLDGVLIEWAEVAALRASAVNTSGLLCQLGEMCGEAVEYAKTLEQLKVEPGNAQQQAGLDAARESLRGTWTALWQAGDEAQLETAGTMLAGVRQQVVALGLPVPPSPARGLSRDVAEGAGTRNPGDARGSIVSKARIRLPFLFPRPQEPRTRVQQLARRARRRRSLYGAGYLWLTMAVAALTGLNQLYLDGPYFGTLQDYVLAVLWGFGTKLGLDVVRDTLETRSLPWPDFLTPGRKSQEPVTAPVEMQYPAAVNDPGAPQKPVAVG